SRDRGAWRPVRRPAATQPRPGPRDRAPAPPRLHQPGDRIRPRRARKHHRLAAGKGQSAPERDAAKAGRRRYTGQAAGCTHRRPPGRELKMTDEFDSWLEGELAKAYVSFGAAALPVGAPYRSQPGAGGSRLFGSFAFRAVVVAIVTVAGLATTSVRAAAAVTRSADPLVWSRQLVNAIATCSGQQAGHNGVGPCLNSIVHSRRSTVQRDRSEGNGGGDGPRPKSTTELVPAGQ